MFQLETATAWVAVLVIIIFLIALLLPMFCLPNAGRILQSAKNLASRLCLCLSPSRSLNSLLDEDSMESTKSVICTTLIT